MEPLTERQRLVISLIAKGYTNPQIADELGVTIDGAKWHVREILSKLGVDSREDAAQWWRQEQRIDRRLQRTFRGIAGSVALRWVAASLAGVVGVAAVVIALQAVSRTAGEAPAPSPPPPGASSTPGAPGTPSAGGGLRVTHYGPNDTLDQPGIYFLNTQTGAVEGWSVEDRKDGEVWVHVPSADNRLVAAWDIYGADRGYVVDRATGATFEFGSGDWQPLLQAGSGISGDLVATDRIVVLKESKPHGQPGLSLRLLELSDGSTRDILVDAAIIEPGASGALSPDERHLAFAAGRVVFWIDLTTGTVQRLFESSELVGLLFEPEGDGLLIREGAATTKLLSWDGSIRDYPPSELVGSPDQTLAARWQAVVPPLVQGPSFTPALGYTEVLDEATGSPRFRVLGAVLQAPGAPQRWLSDSSGVVMQTVEGFVVVSPAGEVTQRLPGAGGTAVDWPIPAPDDPSLFALGIRGFVRNGDAPVLYPPVGPIAASLQLSPWGTSSAEVRIGLHGLGIDYGGLSPLLTPVIQFAPYAGPPQLVVSNTGACLNVREQPDTTAPVRRCYPDGTIAEPATTTIPPPEVEYTNVVEPYGTHRDQSGEPWIYLRMPDGIEGWASAEFLAWEE